MIDAGAYVVHYIEFVKEKTLHVLATFSNVGGGGWGINFFYSSPFLERNLSSAKVES